MDDVHPPAPRSSSCPGPHPMLETACCGRAAQKLSPAHCRGTQTRRSHCHRSLCPHPSLRSGRTLNPSCNREIPRSLSVFFVISRDRLIPPRSSRPDNIILQETPHQSRLWFLFGVTFAIQTIVLRCLHAGCCTRMCTPWIPTQCGQPSEAHPEVYG
jgi:hypothetical protein